MDIKKIWTSIGFRFTLILVGALCIAGPVRADVPPPDNEYRVNSVGIQSGKLPAPLPRMPDPVSLPDIDLPSVNYSDWPTTVDEREAMKTLVANRIYRMQDALNTQYSHARAQISAVRETTNAFKELVGDPTAVVGAGAARSVTVVGMAQEMAQSTSFALGYARAVSGIGPLGLDMVFLFVGLSWIIFVNSITMLIQAVAWFVRMLGNVLDWIWRLLLIIIQLVRLWLNFFELFWPF